MPRGDGTGPLGQGPMNGRGTGACGGNMNRGPAAGQNSPRLTRQGQGLGQRMSKGLGNLRQRLRIRRSGRGRGRRQA